MKFYENIHNIWSELCTIHTISKPIIVNQTIWNNRYITIENTPFQWKRWVEAGIQKIGDLINGNSFLSQTELTNKYNIHPNFLELLQIRQSLPLAWRNIIYEQEDPELFHGNILYFF